ncbi:MAG: hypothetical protein R3C05_20990 [Pirellulaceae bacterium]
MKRIICFITSTLLCLASVSLHAQEPIPAAKPIVLQDARGYESVPRPLTTAELRQQIALEKKRQRIARIEYNEWLGHSPLRPNASDMPMMRSNYVYPYVRFIYVPVLVR